MADNAVQDPWRRYAGFEAVNVRITIRVGRADCSAASLSEMKEGELIRLDRKVGSAFDLLCGDILLGKVEPVSDGDRIAVKLISVAEADDDPSD